MTKQSTNTKPAPQPIGSTVPLNSRVAQDNKLPEKPLKDK